MKSKKKDIRITIRVEQETRDSLQVLADKNKRTLSDYIRIKIEDFIFNEKDKEAVK